MAVVAMSSCTKDENVKKGGEDTTTFTLSLNKEGGKEITDRTGAMMSQYYYSLQYTFDLGSGEFGTPIINSDATYDDVEIYKNPEETKEDKLPINGSWQLLLTEYITEASYIDENEDTKWMKRPMVGMLINKDNGVTVSQVKGDDFESISLATAKEKTFSSSVDQIGIEWWSNNPQTHKYEIVENNYYLIKVGDNEIYKLRFENFYGLDKTSGKAEKGNITFQYELLK